MTAERIHARPTPETVLARMRPGLTYTAHQLAGKFRVSTVEIRTVLDAMVAADLIRPNRVKGMGVGFRRPTQFESSPADAVEEPVVTTALPRDSAPMSSTLTGYEAQIQDFVKLCMATRRG